MIYAKESKLGLHVWYFYLSAVQFLDNKAVEVRVKYFVEASERVGM